MNRQVIKQELGQQFICPRCKHQGGIVAEVAMAGTGLSRFLEIQHHRYAFVSCPQCGSTEVFNMKVLAGKDSLGTLLEILFSN